MKELLDDKKLRSQA